MAELESVAERTAGSVLHFAPAAQQIRIRTERQGGMYSSYIDLGDFQDKEKPFFQASVSDNLKASSASKKGVWDMVVSEERDLVNAYEAERHIAEEQAEEQLPPYEA
jgi:hypothetical protein